MCLKEPGPKAARSLPSRPLPSPLDAVLTSEEALLLTYAYTGRSRWNTLSAFLKIIAAEYGPAIPFPPLRHAVIASAAHALPSDQFSEIKRHHVLEGWKALCSKLGSGVFLDQTEAFATSILADIAWDSNPSSSDSLKVVQIGQFALDRVNVGTGERPLSNLFSLFGLYFRDGLRFCEMTELSLTAEDSDWFIPPQTSFTKRRRYHEEFQRIQSNNRTGAEAAVFDTLQEIMHALVCCLLRGASKTKTIETELWVKEETHHILSDFNDTELQQCISTVRNSDDSASTDKWIIESQPATFVLVLEKCIHILFDLLLENRWSSIHEGIRHLNGTTAAEVLISSIRCPFPGNPLRSWMTYGACLLLGAMTLDSSNNEGRMHPHGPISLTFNKFASGSLQS